MKRRQFIAGLGGAAAWPVVARAQQGTRVRRIGVLMSLMSLSSDDAEGQARNAALLQGLGGLGRIVGRNVSIEYRWAGGNSDLYRRYAQELVALAPDILVASGASAAIALQQTSRTVPIVFASATDPVGAGLAMSLAQPGGNAIGFALPEYGVGGKWLELLKEIAPRVTRVAVIRDASVTAGTGGLAAIQTVAPSFRIEVSPVGTRDADEIERGIKAFARGSNEGLIVPNTAAAVTHRNLIIALAAQHRLPAVYGIRVFVTSGGLISYAVDTIDQWRLAAGYVDRILNGEKPADLPVQAPTKYQTVLNLKTAKALGLTIPETLLATADEVIQ
jgi:putative tryptophan/tyrosine transport system substrate-binding protein